jgi:predicted ATPase
MLLGDRGSLVDETNYWLDRIRARCTVVVQQLVAPKSSAERQSEDHVDETVRRLLLSTDSETLAKSALVLPSEVGAGISQVMPVIVAALARRATGVVIVEQPELHVHPALQARLGDLFVEASSSRAFLIETHSEHLILRLLRRIRETHERATPGAAHGTHDELRRRRNEAAHGIGPETAKVAELTEALREYSTLTPDKLSVLYVESHEGGVRITRLRVGEDGQFLDLWPKGFFDERFEELYGTP